MKKKVLWGLTKKEEKLFNDALKYNEKASKKCNDFYKSIENRFYNAGYNGQGIVDELCESDVYVLSEDGGTRDDDYWDIIKDRLERCVK